MAGQNKYKCIAQKCSQFSPQMSQMDSFTNTVGESTNSVSCLSCGHFKNQHCELDLYDKIDANNDFGSPTE